MQHSVTYSDAWGQCLPACFPCQRHCGSIACTEESAAATSPWCSGRGAGSICHTKSVRCCNQLRLHVACRRSAVDRGRDVAGHPLGADVLHKSACSHAAGEISLMKQVQVGFQCCWRFSSHDPSCPAGGPSEQRHHPVVQMPQPCFGGHVLPDAAPT